MNIEQPPWMPNILYRAIKEQHASYDKGDSDFTVTELIRPAWQAALQRKHHEEIKELADERIWSLFGSAIHSFIEKSAQENDTTEKRLFIKRMGYKISGQMDHMEFHQYDHHWERNLYDWKVTSAYAGMSDQPAKPEWSQQLNLLKLLYDNQDYVNINLHYITNMYVIAFFRDWSEKKYLQDMATYPKHPYAQFQITPWTSGGAEDFLIERIRINLNADLQANGQKVITLLCSPEERWHKPDTWAAKSPGAKRAQKVFYSEKEAKDWVNAKPLGKKTYDIEHRPGEDTRCMKYCNVNQFCPHFKQLVKDQIKQTKEAA